MQMIVTLPDHLEAIFVDPEMKAMGVFRDGDLVDTDWKIAQVRVKREISHPYVRVPWGELFMMTALSAIVYQQFKWTGLLCGGIALWIAQKITNHVAEEIEDRKRVAAQAAREARNSASSPSAEE